MSAVPASEMRPAKDRAILHSQTLRAARPRDSAPADPPLPAAAHTLRRLQTLGTVGTPGALSLPSDLRDSRLDIVAGRAKERLMAVGELLVGMLMAGRLSAPWAEGTIGCNQTTILPLASITLK